MVGKDLIMATLFGSGGGSSGGGDEKPLLDAVIDRTATEIRSDTVENVPEYTFYRYANAYTVNFPKVKKIGTYAFSAGGIVSALLPSAAGMGGTSAFASCKNLGYINLHSLTGVGAAMFSGCASLPKADFASMETIGTNAFNSCSMLSALILRKNAVATLNNTGAFSQTPIESGAGYIYVPRALVDAYKAATNWSTFADQFRALEDYTVDGTITGELDESKI